MSDPQFIDEIAPETTVHVTVVLKGAGKPITLAASFTQAAELTAAHSSRDPTARHMNHVVAGNSGLYSFDLDEVAVIYTSMAKQRDVVSLLNKVGELSS